MVNILDFSGNEEKLKIYICTCIEKKKYFGKYYLPKLVHRIEVSYNTCCTNLLRSLLLCYFVCGKEEMINFFLVGVLVSIFSPQFH